MKLVRRSGFTLLEVMLSILLIAIGVVAGIELLQRAQPGMADGESVLVATHLAQRRLEELRNVAYASLASEAEAAVSDPAGFGQFRREVSVTTPQPNLRRVQVLVSWDAPGGEADVSLETYRSAL